MQQYTTIIKPVVTEKASNQQAKGQYTFVVRKDATKIDVKLAIKTLYGVDVETVRTSILPSKSRLISRGREWKKRSVTKKAVITLKGKQTIDPNKLHDSKKTKSTKVTKAKAKK